MIRHIRLPAHRGLFAVLLAFSLLSCSEPVVEQKKLRPVKVIIAELGGNQMLRVFSGRSQSAEEANLSFKVAGTLAAVDFNVGDPVQRGDVIARLDEETYRVELDQSKADLAQANAKRRNAEAEYQRVKQLYANNNASRNELDNALADADSAIATFEAAQQAERLAQLNLGYTKLVASSDCTVAEEFVEVNENVSAGQAIVEVSCGALWEIEIDVPETLIAKFREGMRGTAVFAAIPDKTFDLTVNSVSIGRTGSSVYPVTFVIEQPPQNIRANLAADVTMGFKESKENLIYLPASAVVQDERGTYVYKVEIEDGQSAAILRRQSVSVGALTADGISVLDGIAAGDVIMLLGQANARDGMRVRVPQEVVL